MKCFSLSPHVLFYQGQLSCPEEERLFKFPMHQTKKKKTSFSSLLPGKLGRSNQRENKAESGGGQPVLFRRGSEDDLHVDGERLVQALPEIQTDPGCVSEKVRLRLG